MAKNTGRVNRNGSANRQFIVGVGGSQGSLEALQRILRRFDESSNVTIVFLHDFAPRGERVLARRIISHSSLKVVSLKRKTKLKPKTIYIAPSGRFLEVKQGAVRICKTQPERQPIDHFLQSLAADQGPRSVGILLSGVGADGKLGLKAVRAAGGVTFAQRPRVTKTSGRPNAATTRIADHILAPSEIAVKLKQHMARDANALTSVQNQSLPVKSKPSGDVERWKKELKATQRRLKNTENHLSGAKQALQEAHEKLEASTIERRSAIAALAKSNSNFENLLRCTEVATIFLDDKLRIRGFTPAAKQIYGLIDTDIGRPLTQLMPCVDDMPPLPDPHQVQADEVIEHLLNTHSGKSFARRVQTYFNSDGNPDGLTVTFKDVSELQSSQELLRRSLAMAEMDAFELDLGTGIIHRYGSLMLRLGLEETQRIQDFLQFVHPSDRPSWLAAIHNCHPDAPFYSHTYRLHRSDKSYVWLREDVDVHFDDHGQPLHLSGSCRDVTVEAQALESLQQKERQLRTITDATPALIAYVDSELRYRFVNRPYARQFGKSVDELIGKAVHELFSEKTYAEIRPRLEAVLRGERQSYELQLDISGSEQPGFKEVTYVPDLKDTGIVDGFFVLVIDITQRKQVASAIADREALLRQLIDNMSAFIGVIDLDGTVLEANQTCLDIVGATRSDVVGKKFWDCDWWTYDPQVSHQIEQFVQQARAGQVVRRDVISRIADDGRIEVELMLSPVKDQHGNVTKIIPSGVDITQRKKVERTIREHQSQLNLAMQAGRLGAWRWDIAQDRVTWSDQMYDVFGYTKAQFVPTRDGFIEIIHPEDRDDVQQQLNAVFSGACEEYEMEFRVIRGDDGSTMWTHGRGAIHRDQAGHPLSITAVASDITDRKRWERDLADQQAHLRRVIDNMLGFVGVLDVEGTLLEANNTALIAGGLLREEVIGKKFWDCYWWNFDYRIAEQLRDSILRAAAGEIIRYDTTVRMAEDTRIVIDFMLVPVRDDQGVITHLIPSGVDISDRKQAEQTVIERERHLNLALEAGRLGAWDWDISHDRVHWSEQMYQVFGYSQSDFDGSMEGFISTIHADDRDQVRERILAAIGGDSDDYTVEFRIIRPDDGRVIWVHSRGMIRRDKYGQPNHITGVASDITNRKHWELELADRESHLRRVINNQLGLVGVIDHNGILLEVDDRSLRIAGLTREDVIGKHFAECAWWTYDESVTQKMRNAMEDALTGEVVRFDVPLYAEGNQRLMIDFMIAPVRDDEGNIAYLIPSGVDISERVQAERAYRETAIRLKAIFNTVVDGIVTIDNQGIINSINPAAIELFGYQAEEMVGQNVKMLMPEPYHSEHGSYLTNYWRTRVRKIIGLKREVQGRRKDGSVFPLELAVSETSLDGEHCFVGIVRDITERKQAELAMKEKEERLAMALRAGGMAAWEWSPQESFWTEELYQLMGISSDQVATPELFFRFVHPEDVAGLQAAWEKAIAGLDEYEHEFRIVRPNGEFRWVVGVGELVRDDDGQVVRMFGLNWDCTKEHVAAESLRESERKAQEASVLKSQFLANMSHEIRTPMTAVLGYTELLAAREVDPEKKDYLQTIKRNGNFLLEIINDILDLSKIEAGKLTLNDDWFEPDAIVTEVRSMMGVRASEKKLDFEVQYDGALPARVRSDPQRLKQILVNLVGNAIKFTQTGSVRLISRYLPGNTTQLQFDVVDTGIGISDEQQTLLFRPFSQGDATVSRNFGGTGLGLAISQRLCKLLGGQISVNSQPGVGSTFTCTITVEVDERTELVHPHQQRISAASDTRLAEQQLQCCVLVVDDRRDVRFLTKHFLEKAGAKVVLAEDGERALELYERVKQGLVPDIDLILLDMQMPRLDGYQSATLLRERGFQKPIIALTADAMHGDMNRCIECGCDSYLSKPIDGKSLVELVAHFTTEGTVSRE